jgi:transcription-repair coupling factor (superfamily II helicase)
MEKGCPMDRLLCGDVGYGKTEVAFRAIFKAIMDNKQVAILCPTTILSSQHFNNALERFKSYAVEIQLLNRFVPNNKVKSILERLENGRVDILIGTHRILSDDIKFKDLGLLVIDEEQRFGVKHKEKIKQLKNSVDVLTLSATPIPRTLQMSMVGIRNLSLIETPPVDRYPIQTYVLAENNQIIKDAIYKELSRNGQCFILFNNIKDLESKKMEIMRLVPEANIVTAHGKLSKNELESIMTEFIERKYDVLLCTTIIETGIDIPNANTLIVYDADHFGLSQLYQLRGRVGRSNKIAYCYLMYEKTKILSEVAVKRLQAIKEFTELGSGFSIAMRDLSIRGAGDILGSEQAGFVDTIGVEMFMKMLEDEIAKLKGIKVKEREDYNPLIEVETSISNEFVEDEEIKIEIHKMINKINDYESLEKTKEELEDRFGKLSDNIVIYMYQEMFEKMATNLNISKVVQTKNSIELFIPETLLQKINIGNLFAEVTTKNRSFRFTSRNKQLVIILDIVKLDKHFIYYLIELLETIKKYLDKI